MPTLTPWYDPPEITLSDELRAAVGGRALVAETLARRGIVTADAARAFLDPACYTPAPPTDLPGLDVAVRRLEVALRRREAICVWGDFDVDGQTATAALVETLAALGGNVSYHVPVRGQESHGVNTPVLARLIAGGAHLLLTCDTGISSHEAIAYAQARGVDVIVTDHHTLPAALPTAYAAVNPQFLPAGHPLRTLPGVGVAYKLAEALCARVGRPALAARCLDLVALGIVADVATQTGDTRYLLQCGLAALRATERAGLLAMCEANGLDPRRLTEEHIGFVLGPRLNALGRLADANLAVELLTTADVAQARILAGQLEALNAQRKLLCEQVYAAAEAQIARDPALLDEAALVLAHPSWPAGVIGIVAGRLAERYDRPTLLIACPPGEPGRGSARSRPGCDITAAIAAHAEMLLGFGGHPMAAGLSIEAARIPEFRRSLARTVAAMAGPETTLRGLQLDGELPLAALSLALVDDLERLAPFGPGNPPLTFVARDVRVVSRRTVGRGGEHWLAAVASGERAEAEGAGETDAPPDAHQVIWWQGAGEALPQGRFDLAYTVRASDYRGQRQVQLEWLAARALEDVADDGGAHAAAPAAAHAARAGRTPIEVVDYRKVADPRRVLAELLAGRGDAPAAGDALVWREGAASAEISGRGRLALSRAAALVVWTTPPGNAEWRAALEAVRPARVYLFGADDGATAAGPFLERLVGLVKNALRAAGGRVSLPALAAACAQREATVAVGLDWLAARGMITMQPGDVAGEALLGVGVGPQAPAPPTLTAQLQAALAETAAYRAYFLQAEVASLLAA